MAIAPPPPRPKRLRRLAELSRLERFDPTVVRGCFPSEAKQHTGRMRVSLIRELLCRYRPGDESAVVVADPLAGTGATGVAAALEGYSGFVGYEIIPRWADVARQAIASAAAGRDMAVHFKAKDAATYSGRPRFNLLISSPPFPNSHTQGKSEMQVFLRESKATHAGNEFECNTAWGVGFSPVKEKWIAELARTITPWSRFAQKGTIFLIHIKNFIRGGVEIEVDRWVAEAMASRMQPNLSVLGYHPVPLGYRSGFQEWRRFPRHEVLTRSLEGSHWKESLSCGHVKHRRLTAARQLPKKSICTECGPLQGLIEVREERVVVATKR